MKILLLYFFLPLLSLSFLKFIFSKHFNSYASPSGGLTNLIDLIPSFHSSPKPITSSIPGGLTISNDDLTSSSVLLLLFCAIIGLE